MDDVAPLVLVIEGSFRMCPYVVVPRGWVYCVGNVELLDIEDGVVTLRMMGSCGGCPMSTMTLKQGIEQRLKETVLGITRVDAI